MQKSGTSEQSWVFLYIALGIVWGCSFIFIKLGLEFLTPFGVAFGRCVLGAAALLLLVKVKKIALPRDRQIWFHIWVVSLLLNVLPGIFYALAETEVTSVLAGINNAITPLMTLLAILLIGRDESPKLYQIVGLAIGFGGVLVVLGIWQGLGSNPPWAIAVLLGAVTCYGFAFPYIRRFVAPYKLKAESVATTQLIAASVTLLPLFVYDGLSSDEYRAGPVLAMLALGIFGSGFAYIWNLRILEAAGSAIASSVTYVTPVVAVIVGIAFLGEKISWYEPVGAVIVLLGAAIAQNRIKLFSRA